MKQPRQQPSHASDFASAETSSTPEKAGSEQGLRVLSYLIAGMLLYGALGWLGDRFFETQFLMPIGIVLGMALSIFMIIRRFGGTDTATAAPVSSSHPVSPDQSGQ